MIVCTGNDGDGDKIEPWMWRAAAEVRQPVEALKRLVLAAAKDPQDPILWTTVVAVQCETGARSGEVIQLSGNEVSCSPGRATVRIGGRKGYRPSTTVLSPELSDLVNRYIRTRPAAPGVSFFRYQNGRPVSRQAYAMHTSRWVGRSPAPAPGPHGVRHLVLAWLLRERRMPPNAADANLSPLGALPGWVAIVREASRTLNIPRG